MFQQSFLPGTPKTPDRLAREAYVVHYVLRRSVLYRMGNTESITWVQQWLLMYVMAKSPFDIVDILISEVEDAIMVGMEITRQQPRHTGSTGCCPILRLRGTWGCWSSRSSPSRPIGLQCPVTGGAVREV
jgi:hypothetical protein